MLILSRVCADFTDRNGRTVFSVTPDKLLSFLDAPDDIRQDPLFDLLTADGSMEAVHSVEKRKALEADPAAGTDAEGRRKPAAKAKEPASAKEAHAPDADAAKAGRKE